MSLMHSLFHGHEAGFQNFATGMMLFEHLFACYHWISARVGLLDSASVEWWF